MNASRPDADREFIQRAVRLAIIAAAIVGSVLALLWVLAGALTPLVAAFVVAYLFDPLIDRFEAKGIGRRAAIFLLLGLAALVIFGFAFYVVPRMQHEIVTLSASLPGYLERLLDRAAPKIQSWFGYTIPRSLEEGLESLRSGSFQLLLDSARNMLERSLRLVTGTVGTLVGLLVIPVIAYYLLAEFDAVKRAILGWVPRPYQRRVAEKAAVVDALVSGFIRGQLLVCLLDGLLYAVGFAAIGVDLAIGIGFAAGLLSIIPYVGGGFALGSASLLCVLEWGFDLHLALVVGWYLAVQTLEGFVLVPRIVGRSVGMHPVTVIVALLIGGDLLGFLGLLVAVPLAAVVQVFLRDGLAAYLRSPLYQGGGEGAQGGAGSD
jgi:predicted PurR-regulated permease PerM